MLEMAEYTWVRSVNAWTSYFNFSYDLVKALQWTEPTYGIRSTHLNSTENCTNMDQQEQNYKIKSFLFQIDIVTNFTKLLNTHQDHTLYESHTTFASHKQETKRSEMSILQLLLWHQFSNSSNNIAELLVISFSPRIRYSWRWKVIKFTYLHNMNDTNSNWSTWLLKITNRKNVSLTITKIDI